VEIGVSTAFGHGRAHGSFVIELLRFELADSLSRIIDIFFLIH
jgi:hypothetical protein